MASYDVQLTQLESVPLAVVRRQANARDLARVVPECCGLVWNVVRAQKTEAGRHVAIYWDGSIRLEVGVELIGPFAEDGEVMRSSTPAGAVAATTHYSIRLGFGRTSTISCQPPLQRRPQTDEHHLCARRGRRSSIPRHDALNLTRSARQDTTRVFCAAILRPRSTTTAKQTGNIHAF
jgi:hypothetical protein